MCPRFVALVVSALFRWPCSVSIHLSPRSVTAGGRPFPLAMQHVYSFVSYVISLLLSPRFGACTAGVRPFPLAMQHFYSLVSHVISFLLCPRFGACTGPCSISLHWCPPFSAGHVALLFICLPALSLLVPALFRWPCSISIHVSPM